MVRPKIEDFQMKMTESGTILVNDYKRYSEALERYCDELENENKSLLFCWKKADGDLRNLVKGFDNACDMLETYDLANKELTREKHTKEQWRKWCIEK